MKRVFLGGTCNQSNWRKQMMVYVNNQNMDYFNPVTDDWNDDAQANEIRERESCDFCLYTLTPKMTGTYSIAEVVDDSNKRPEKTVMVLLREDGKEGFTKAQWKSLSAVAKMVKRNGGQVFYDLKLAALYMGSKENQG